MTFGEGEHVVDPRKVGNAARGNRGLLDGALYGILRAAELDYDDPDYPGPDNPTTVYRAVRPAAA